MKIFLRLASFSLFILAGCATTSDNPNNFQEDLSFKDYGKPLGTHYLTRPQRQSQLSHITSWAAQGNIAVKTMTKGWNASFNWQQNQGNYSLALFGPLGSNHVQLTGTPQQVILQSSRGTKSATDPETLIEQELGWRIPISNLYYWLRGLPSPLSKARQSYDMNNHLVHLYQQGWHIIYLRYISVDGKDLPNRMLITGPKIEVRIVITQWKI